MKLVFKNGIIFIFCIATNLIFAQQKDSLNLKDLLKKEKKSYFKLQTSYLSNSVFNGRKDSTALPYIMPSLEYNHSSGFYINGTISYLANTSSRVDVVDVSVGYSFEKEDTYGANFYANKSFYNDNSNNVQSDIKGSLGAMFNYYTNIVNFNTSANALISSTTDLSLSFGVDHSFYWGSEASLFSITPTITSYFGGSGFYQSYTEKRKNPRNNLPTGIKIEISSPKNFQLMSYEISSPINYDASNWGLFLTPTFAIPQNAVKTIYTIKGPMGNTIKSSSYTEKLENVFFFELGAYVKF